MQRRAKLADFTHTHTHKRTHRDTKLSLEAAHCLKITSLNFECLECQRESQRTLQNPNSIVETFSIEKYMSLNEHHYKKLYFFLDTLFEIRQK